jgi:serine/threonine protein kinase
MSLSPGQRLGPYEVVGAIGAGGMGEVYRARDTKLGRDVALKVLLAPLAADPDRLARFRREAQVLASLNHPNIGHIYGFEDGGTTHALVLELIEGPTLADRISQGAIPVAEALPIARQIAEALEAAHEHGIVHRDLKPANIKLRPDGTVKVLDFGLAKAMEPVGASSVDAMNSPTLSIHATQAGMVLGTAAYMSPEQARGKAVDRRTDLWAFGAVLYEMLTASRTFPGDEVTDMIVSVMSKEPDWDRLPAETPGAIRTLLRRCLRKEPRQRLADAGAARMEIDDAMAGPVGGAAAPPQRNWR